MRFTPIAPGVLAAQIAAAVPESDHPARVAVDGASAADPVGFADLLDDPLRQRGHRLRVLRADHFWRDASVRLEYGHQDVQSYLETWLDAPAIAREVLTPLGPGGDGRYLASLRDPISNRSTRDAVVADPRDVVVVAGALLLGRGLDFDLTVHLALSPGALTRRTEQAWTVAAFEQYEAGVRPRQVADVVVRIDDPARPALGSR